MLYFLLSTLVLTLYIDVVLSLSIVPNDAYASVKWVSMCSDIGLSLSGCQAINRTNVDLQCIQRYAYISPLNDI